MRLYVAPLLLALVSALLIPISASAQTDTFCTAAYDANGDRVRQTGVSASCETQLGSIS